MAAMKYKAMTPAEYVIHILGGVRPAARILGRSPGAVSKWSGKRGGVVPTAIRPTILEYAKKHRLPITSEDLDVGRKVKL